MEQVLSGTVRLSDSSWLGRRLDIATWTCSHSCNSIRPVPPSIHGPGSAQHVSCVETPDLCQHPISVPRSHNLLCVSPLLLRTSFTGLEPTLNLYDFILKSLTNFVFKDPISK